MNTSSLSSILRKKLASFRLTDWSYKRSYSKQSDIAAKKNKNLAAKKNNNLILQQKKYQKPGECSISWLFSSFFRGQPFLDRGTAVLRTGKSWLSYLLSLKCNICYPHISIPQLYVCHRLSSTVSFPLTQAGGYMAELRTPQQVSNTIWITQFI